MVNYKCPRCGYENSIKTKYTKHLNRKRICNNTLSNNNLEDEYIKYNIIEKIKKDEDNTKSTQNHTNLHKIKCIFCKKIYSRMDSLNRHLKTCKEKQEEQAKESMTELVKILNEQLKEKNKELEKRDKELEKRDKQFEKQIHEQNKQIQELIKKAGINNSNITQNIQNNIKLLAYKDTDLSMLREKDIISCMQHSNMCVPHLIKMIHLNPKKPENHNIYISNLKNGYIMVYNGDNWDTLNRDDVIDEMINDKECLIQDKVEDWIETGIKYPIIMRKFERYLEKKEKNKVLNKIKEEIRLMLFNNKNLVLTNDKQKN